MCNEDDVEMNGGARAIERLSRFDASHPTSPRSKREEERIERRKTRREKKRKEKGTTAGPRAIVLV